MNRFAPRCVFRATSVAYSGHVGCLRRARQKTGVWLPSGATDPEGVMLAVLSVEEVWQPDQMAEAEAVFGTTSRHIPVWHFYSTVCIRGMWRASWKAFSFLSTMISVICAKHRQSCARILPAWMASGGGVPDLEPNASGAPGTHMACRAGGGR